MKPPYSTVQEAKQLVVYNFELFVNSTTTYGQNRAISFPKELGKGGGITLHSMNFSRLPSNMLNHVL